MDSEMINLSTGPVQISAEIKNALIELPIPHRSQEFTELYRASSDILCGEYQVNHGVILTGSGTLANEVMLHQLKKQKGKGLVLANGEFGERLIDQAQRIALDFIIYKNTWGEAFDLNIIEQTLKSQGISWMVFTHCETSTGVINDLQQLVAVSNKYNCNCYVDCMSTIGTRALDLSGVTMASASSGKGFASIPGLAVLLSNIDTQPDPTIPAYLDLGQYMVKSGVPYTLSSNLLKAFHVSLCQKLTEQQYDLTAAYSRRFFRLFSSLKLTPFNNANSHVFTIAPPAEEYYAMLEDFKRMGLVVSFESEYLRRRKWIQFALFNYYTETQLEFALKLFDGILGVQKQTTVMRSK